MKRLQATGSRRQVAGIRNQNNGLGLGPRVEWRAVRWRRAGRIRAAESSRVIWILFDIDGTLLHAHGLGRNSFNRAFEDVYSRPDALDGIELAGATDCQVIRRVLRELLQRDFTAAEYDALVARFTARFIERKNGTAWPVGGQALPAYQVVEIPGASALVRRLHGQKSVQLGLATGNLRVTAEMKVGLIGVAECFDFALGGYGDAVETREGLLVAALAALEAAAQDSRGTGVPKRPERRVYFGDTLKDVAAARSLGMEVVGVRSHAVQGAQLQAAGAHHVVDDFRDMAGILRWLGVGDGRQG